MLSRSKVGSFTSNECSLLFSKMAPRRVPIQRGNNANEDQFLQENGPVPNVVPNIATNEEFRTTLTMLTNVVTNQVGRQASTPASRVKDFTRMNPPEFHGSKVDEDPQAFIDEVSRVVTIMGVTSEEGRACGLSIQRSRSNMV